MISVEEALQLVRAQIRDYGTEEVELLQSTGHILAQDIVADRAYPPFNRVTMDGIAINSKAFSAGRRSFKIEGVQAAGQPQQTLVDTDNCLEVMTGAMLPLGTDVVIPYEQCEIVDGVATVNIEEVSTLQNVHLEGTDSKQGDILVQSGHKITPAIVGLIAASGLSKILVKRLPKVAVCATGDELVEVDEQPLPHQIRQSNSYMLIAALHAEGIHAQRYHLRDDPQVMLEELTTITNYYDVVLLSGAVSKGKFDHLPNVLNRLKMEAIFHGIAQRPGKPFLFGKLPNEVLIFGFPGNPASTFVCYQLYFKAWLYQSLGISLPVMKAFLSRPFSFKPNLTLHALVTITYNEGKLIATPIETSTSGDMVNLALAQGILSLPADRNEFTTDEAFDLQVV
ncbi:molybdopterin molybdotransferase MoeA [Mucilaginibacter jinjuensis]|uniref:Molybdopterin molybdenumtransferase n=1 Tax=Mucilaginibacter jinjuensis TaxID=1176721 RepID=A0ABY7TBY2_9SPHI|nr:molybdopterin molybdotransferase MoeA [Mucilaginibacter jinjuensis]WCT14024.1 molybdopterin molybdotransferase MoeA [Mucilaginibacter jinjuensis]